MNNIEMNNIARYDSLVLVTIPNFVVNYCYFIIIMFPNSSSITACFIWRDAFSEFDDT